MNIKSSIKGFSYLILLGAMSCAWDQTTPDFDCDLNPIQLEILEQNATGCVSPTGGFTIGITGGESPYTYTSATATGTDGVFEQLTAGSYDVVVTDANDCSGQLTVEIDNTDGVNLDEVLLTDAGCNTSQGIIEMVGSGGREPYLYSLNNGATQEDNTFSDLPVGTHSISISDQDGCEVTQDITLTTGVSFSNVESIINNRCTVCHGVSASPSFDSYDEISASAGRIMARTTAKTMPPGGNSLPQSEIDAIACWVSDGALED